MNLKSNSINITIYIALHADKVDCEEGLRSFKKD